MQTSPCQLKLLYLPKTIPIFSCIQSSLEQWLGELEQEGQ